MVAQPEEVDITHNLVDGSNGRASGDEPDASLGRFVPAQRQSEIADPAVASTPRNGQELAVPTHRRWMRWLGKQVASALVGALVGGLAAAAWQLASLIADHLH